MMKDHTTQFRAATVALTNARTALATAERDLLGAQDALAQTFARTSSAGPSGTGRQRARCEDARDLVAGLERLVASTAIVAEYHAIPGQIAEVQQRVNGDKERASELGERGRHLASEMDAWREFLPAAKILLEGYGFVGVIDGSEAVETEAKKLRFAEQMRVDAESHAVSLRVSAASQTIADLEQRRCALETEHRELLQAEGVLPEGVAA
jgi:hypothetical protein